MDTGRRDRQLDKDNQAISGERRYVRRLLLAYGVGIIVLLLIALFWFAAEVFLLTFSSVLVAILLHGASRAIERKLPIPRAIALSLAIVAILTLLTLGAWFLAPLLAEQGNQLAVELPAAVEQFRTYLRQHPVLHPLMRNLPSPDQALSSAMAFLTRSGNVFSGLLGGIGNFVIVLFISTYLAISPYTYINGIVALLPIHRRPRAREVFHELGETLGLWLRGKLLSMVVVGIATATGLSLLGVPLALALGILAGLLDFIPYLGPILAAVPAVLMAFSHEPMLAFYVCLFLLAVQMAEAYLLLPLVERKSVLLPPALTILMQVVMGTAFGLVGVALATPITAVLAVLIGMLYVQDFLGDKISLPSDRE